MNVCFGTTELIIDLYDDKGLVLRQFNKIFGKDSLSTCEINRTL